VILGLDISAHAIAIVSDDATLVAHDRCGTATAADAAVADVRIVPAALGDHAAASGAARAALHTR